MITQEVYEVKAISILTGPSTLLDHLGVLSCLLDIPLIVTDPDVFTQAQTFYPQLNVKQLDMQELSIEFLSNAADVIFQTTKAWVAETSPLFKLLGQREPRFVYCPHGNSDKVYSSHSSLAQDLYLVYGDHYLDLLQREGRINFVQRTIRTGNYRLPFYLKHKVFYDQLCEAHVFSRFKDSKPTFLYAPTWDSKEIPSSFFTETKQIIEQLKNDYNLIIKLHPKLIEDDPARSIQIMGKHEHEPSVLFLTDFPPIYPLLARCDLYLGDFSSIGYDFLAFDKPLYFLNPSQHQSLSRPYLYQCGIEIPTNQKGRLREFIKETTGDAGAPFHAIRKATYHHVFGEERDPIELKKEIWELLDKERPRI